jgi:hypothetical protein
MTHLPKQTAVSAVESAWDIGERIRMLSTYAEALPPESQKHLEQHLHRLAVWLDAVLEERR